MSPRTMIRLIGEHDRRLDIDSNDFCASSGDEEEVEIIEQLLCYCRALSERRLDILSSVFLESLTELSGIDIRTIDNIVLLKSLVSMRGI